jgi:hypothetical protein
MRRNIGSAAVVERHRLCGLHTLRDALLLPALDRIDSRCDEWAPLFCNLARHRRIGSESRIAGGTVKAEAKYPTASTALSDTKIEISAVSVIAGLFQILDLFAGRRLIVRARARSSNPGESLALRWALGPEFATTLKELGEGTHALDGTRTKTRHPPCLAISLRVGRGPRRFGPDPDLVLIRKPARRGCLKFNIGPTLARVIGCCQCVLSRVIAKPLMPRTEGWPSGLRHRS